MFGHGPASLTSADPPELDIEPAVPFPKTKTSTTSAEAQDCDSEPTASSPTSERSPMFAEIQEFDLQPVTPSPTTEASPTSAEAQDPTTELDSAVAAIVIAQATTTIAADDILDDGYATDVNSNASYSINSSIREYKFEYGRRFHKFKEGRYLLPNDKREQDREVGVPCPPSSES